jgi:hypothetical protein
MILCINNGNWGEEVMVIRLVIDLGELVKLALKREVSKGVDGWGNRYGCCWVLWPLCVFGCISVAVVEGACVRDCRELELCTVVTVGHSVGGECVGESGSVVTGWGRLGWRNEDGE